MTVVIPNTIPGSDSKAGSMPAASSRSSESTIASESSGSPDRVDGVAIAQSRAVRWWLAGLGLVCVALGGLGVVVPGLPTTIFLIMASWCFVRSCPVLERVLIRNRVFAPFLCFLQPGAVMPVRARIVSTIAIWTAIGASVALFIARGTPGFVSGIVIASGLIGTIAVWRIARGSPSTIISSTGEHGELAPGGGSRAADA